MLQPVQITVDGDGANDPIAGANEYHDASLKGQQGYIIKNGYGPLPLGSWEPIATGGFRLLGDELILPQFLGTDPEVEYEGNVFRPNEMYFFFALGISYNSDTDGYTNGFDFGRVINSLFGRVGWKQPPESGSPVLNATNLIARSGRYFQDFHALVSVNNIKDTMEEAGAADANLNAYLEQLQKAAILRCLNGVFREKEYLEQALIYERGFRTQAQAMANESNFVGYEITIAPRMDIAIQIDGATLNFDTDKTFDLYLFAEGKESPIWQQEVSAVAKEATNVSFDFLIMNYIAKETRCRRFYFGYFQDDLGAAKAIGEQSVFNKTFCFQACPMSAKAIGDDFNRDGISLTNIPYGLNLEMSSFRDHTQQVVKKASLFDEAIGLTLAYMILEQIIYSTSSNKTERILKEGMDKVGLQLEMKGAAPISDGPRIKGLSARIDEEMKRMRQSFFPNQKAQVMNYAHCEN